MKGMRFIIVLLLCLLLCLGIWACGDSGGDDGASEPSGLSGPAGTGDSGGVMITSLYANPAVVRPGESTDLAVTTDPSSGGSLTYSWTAASGTISAPETNPVTWTAPDTVGTYIIQVDVTDSASMTSTAYATVLVSVSPTGAIVTNVSPSSARVGDSVTISGAGFGSTQGTSTVSIGGVEATGISSWSEYTIVANVPDGARTGAVTVTAGGAQSSPGYIVILWITSNPDNTAISTAQYNQFAPQITSDGSGGAIITWHDQRSTNYDIYAQLVYSSGVTGWMTNGVAISTAETGQVDPQITSDGAGGAIITWQDGRNGDMDVYAQLVNSSGVTEWTTDGVAISTSANYQLSPQITSDGAGGAIITWEDLRNGDLDVYAQLVNSSGVTEWTTNGVAVSTASDSQQAPQITSDGSGGAIITWEDYRNGNWNVYAQLVNSSGAVEWTTDGVAISNAANIQQAPQIISDGSGGAIITWQDSRPGGNDFDIYAQLVNSSGVFEWSTDGVAISTAASSQRAPQLTSDGSGGAIIAWEDLRNGDFDVYAQLVNSSGAVEWTTDGVAISTALGDQQTPQLTSDGSGGAIITWEDNRKGSGDIYAQRVNSAGIIKWTSDGVAISTASSEQEAPQITFDGAGGAIITWEDGIFPFSKDIYAQGKSAEGM